MQSEIRPKNFTKEASIKLEPLFVSASRSARIAVQFIEEQVSNFLRFPAASDEHHGRVLEGLSGSSEPSFNIDGTPMVGPVDIHGNPYGITEVSLISCEAPFVSSNFDETPMCGAADIHGHSFGVTDDLANASSFSFEDHSSTWESSNRSGGDVFSSSNDDWSSSSSFESSFSSFDD